MLVSKGEDLVLAESCIEESELKVYKASRLLVYEQSESLSKKLLNVVIELYAKIFCNVRLSYNHRSQLCKHLKAHYDDKPFTILLLCYSIARELLKNPSVLNIASEADKIFINLKSIADLACGTSDQLNCIIGSEVIVMLYKSLCNIFPTIINNLISELNKLIDDSKLRSKASLMIAYIFKHFDNLQPLIKSIERVLTMQLGDCNTSTKFNGFFSLYLALKYTGNSYIELVKTNLWLCLHSYNTDIRFDKSLFILICRIFELIVRINPADDLEMLPVIAFDINLSSHCNHPFVSLSLLQFIKHCLISNLHIITPEQCVEIALRKLKSVDSGVKTASLQVLGTLISQGHFIALKKADEQIVWKLLDKLNKVDSNNAYSFDRKKTWNTDWIDIEDTSNKELLYEYILRQLITFVLARIREEDGLIVCIDIVKHVLTHRILYEEDIEKPSRTQKKEGIISEEAKDTSYKFTKSIRTNVKRFVIKVLIRLIGNENRETEVSLLAKQFHNLLSLLFSFISENTHKVLALKLIKCVMKKCRRVKDVVEALNDEEEITESHNALEQYEAQIEALIREYLTENSSCDILNSVFSIFYYFCTIPITRNTTTLKKLMKLLVEPLEVLALSESREFTCEKKIFSCHLKRLKVICKLFFISKDYAFKPHENEFMKEEDKKRIKELFTER